ELMGQGMAIRRDADHDDESGSSPPRRRRMPKVSLPVDPAVSAARRRAALRMHALYDPRQTTARARRTFRESFTSRAAADGYDGAALIKRAATLRRAFYADMTAESIRARKLRQGGRLRAASEDRNWAA